MKKIFLTIALVLISLLSYSPTRAQVATDEGSSVLQKVRDKVTALKKNPKAYIGTITDKTDTSIQLKGLNGKIELVAVSDLTNYSKINKTETEIKFTDIAIGDFVLVLGTLANSDVLNAQNVILSTNPPDDRKVVVGNVKSIVKKQITINSSSGLQTFNFSTRWIGPEIQEINEGDVVVIISIITDGIPLVRTVETVSSSKSE